ncbi:MAG: hypothetical protein Q8L14_03200, partial [Myxococcales bacterium]|nr:hypothetical protein [Myxococcales bacterium]
FLDQIINFMEATLDSTIVIDQHPLGIGLAVLPHRVLGHVALASSAFNLPFGAALLSDAQHRPIAVGATVALALIVAVAFLAVLTLVAPPLTRWPRLAVAVLPSLVIAIVVGVRHDPWARFGVCLVEDSPGATDRFRTFTPVACATGAPLGEPIGADFAVLRFEDLDRDGLEDLVVMESEVSCAWSASYCPEVQTLQSFTLVHTTPLRVEALPERSGVRLR